MSHDRIKWVDLIGMDPDYPRPGVEFADGDRVRIVLADGVEMIGTMSNVRETGDGGREMTFTPD